MVLSNKMFFELPGVVNGAALAVGTWSGATVRCVGGRNEGLFVGVCVGIGVGLGEGAMALVVRAAQRQLHSAIDDCAI